MRLFIHPAFCFACAVFAVAVWLAPRFASGTLEPNDYSGRPLSVKEAYITTEIRLLSLLGIRARPATLREQVKFNAPDAMVIENPFLDKQTPVRKTDSSARTISTAASDDVTVSQ